MAFNHLDIENRWQKIWQEQRCFEAVDFDKRPKFYALNMFPYPSGSGLHCGHLASYTPPDILCRYKRAQGFNVMQPFGYDSFGLPAEQYAIQTGVHPAVTTREAIENFRRQAMSYGYSFDWSREISTCEPDYYKWTQYIFTLLYNKGLAYQKEVPVNWCPALKTVLANDEIVNGKSERGGHPVVRLPMKQWVLKITDYADKLLAGLETIAWPERTKEGQRNWIGKSVGAKVRFLVAGTSHSIEVFTTRPDTLFGVSFLALAPEHPLVKELTTKECATDVANYIAQSSSKSDVERQASQDKTGVFIGAYAQHPLDNAKRIPIWIADYVLADYGTGAVMAVPAHDERDFEFATKFHLPIEAVVVPSNESESMNLPYTPLGKLTASGSFNGLSSDEAKELITATLEKRGLGKREVNFRLRDWNFSRQRYWGEPFPVIHYENGEIGILDVSELPVTLPDVTDFEPTDHGEAPLARAKEWMNYTDKSGRHALRETHTMPGAAGSSWYFLRYTDPHNQAAAFDFEKQKYWMPVDYYFGGPEHTVGHLLYSRFWHQALFDLGLVSTPEPFQKLGHQGMILGPDGEKMSKSRGNTVSTDEVKTNYGADATRVYVTFLGPVERDKPWATSGIEGARRFLDRIWRMAIDDNGEVIVTEDAPPEELNRMLHKTIKKVTEDIESMNLNTAVSAMMILVNEIYKQPTRPRLVVEALLKLLQPFAPHVAEELWHRLGHHQLISIAAWPHYDPQLVIDDSVTMGVQINGKMRGQITIPVDASEEQAILAAKEVASIQAALATGQIVKTIYKAGKILNMVVK